MLANTLLIVITKENNMACGCGGNKGAVAPFKNSNRSNSMNGISKDELIELVNKEPDLFVTVSYDNGLSNKFAFSYARGLQKYGYNYYTTYKFKGVETMPMLKVDVDAAPSNVVTILVGERGIVADTLRKGADIVNKVADKVEELEDKLTDTDEVEDELEDEVEDSTMHLEDDTTDKPVTKKRTVRHKKVIKE